MRKMPGELEIDNEGRVMNIKNVKLPNTWPGIVRIATCFIFP